MTSTSTSAATPTSTRASAPAATPKPTPAGSRNPELQGFRGLAALSTVVFHVWQQYHVYDAQGAHPPVGDPHLAALISLEVIDLFFVMSAYLLTLSYARAAIDGDDRTRPGRDFLFRRATRILPLYFLAVLLVWSLRNPELPGDWRDLVGHLTFMHVFDQKRIFYTLGPSWSLSLEIAFYLTLVAVGPLAIRACRRLRTRRARVALCASGCAALYLAPVAWIAVAHHHLGIPHTEWPVYFGPQARFGGFAAGMGLAVLLVALGDRGRIGARRATAAALAAAAGLYALSYFSEAENIWHTYYHPLAALLWFVLLYCTLHIRTSGRPRWHGLLRANWLTGVGLVSYSLYIWHEPLMLALYDSGALPHSRAAFPLAALIVLAAATLVATISYWTVEYPGSLLARLRDKKGRPREFYPEPAAR
ncbi:acyltransferase [Streptomyces sp. TRM68367]|uniref:acyltransferase family protein n=1 Tax=Streptomyces sp. TRM68367 TaxID=2758415 RepID=UPI00165BB62A|nr:acyltransferase [Streptomyces sp. TRM68367]MBC9724172.1 acyltransferase [Streptomyces sp. TRM68367]